MLVFLEVHYDQTFDNGAGKHLIARITTRLAKVLVGTPKQKV
jgi:hypothetical protein